MNKDGALGALNNVLQNYVFGISSSHFANEFSDALEHVVALFPGPERVAMRANVNELGRALHDADKRREITIEFEAALKRMIVREAFEVALWYGEETNQMKRITGAPLVRVCRQSPKRSVAHTDGCDDTLVRFSGQKDRLERSDARQFDGGEAYRLDAWRGFAIVPGHSGVREG